MCPVVSPVCLDWERGRALPLPEVLRGGSAQFQKPFGDEGRSRIKAGVRSSALPVTTARSAGSFRGRRMGSNAEVKAEFAVVLPEALRTQEKNGGQPRERRLFMSKKEKFALYLTPEKKALLERRYQEDGSRSLTGFIERAIDFYLDYLSAGNAGLFLPASIKSCLDGRLDQLEDRLSALTFRLAVEADLVAGILADTCQLSREELRRRRAESVRNVKSTNGRISLEGRSQETWKEGDEWLD